MKPVVFAGLALTVAFLPSAWGQTPTPELKHVTIAPLNSFRPVSLTALSVERGAEYPSIVTLTGNVEIKAPVCMQTGKKGATHICDGYMIVRADEARFHEDTGQIEAHGNVVITPLRHEPK